MASYIAISHKETKLKQLLLYNGMSILLYNLAFFFVEAIYLFFVSHF